MVNACWPGCPHLMPNNMRMLEGSFSLLISGRGALVGLFLTNVLTLNICSNGVLSLITIPS
jgi:hypothetical protein